MGVSTSTRGLHQYINVWFSDKIQKANAETDGSYVQCYKIDKAFGTRKTLCLIDI